MAAPYYDKPSAPTKLMNSTLAKLASVGLAPRNALVVQVRGRKSGKLRSTIVQFVEHNGERYLVAPRGTTEWVRNVHAANGEALLKRGRARPVKLIDVPAAERAPIIHSYLQTVPPMVQREFGVQRDSPMADVEDIASRHPVFRIIDAP